MPIGDRSRPWGLPGYVVHYPKEEWSRSEAWTHLQKQSIPGCPEWTIGGGRHGWRKAHTAETWCWYFAQFRSSFSVDGS